MTESSRDYMRRRRADPAYRAAERERAHLRKLVHGATQIVGILHPADCNGACGCVTIHVHASLRAKHKRKARKAAILPARKENPE